MKPNNFDLNTILVLEYFDYAVVQQSKYFLELHDRTNHFLLFVDNLASKKIFCLNTFQILSLEEVFFRSSSAAVIDDFLTEFYRYASFDPAERFIEVDALKSTSLEVVMAHYFKFHQVSSRVHSRLALTEEFYESLKDSKLFDQLFVSSLGVLKTPMLRHHYVNDTIHSIEKIGMFVKSDHNRELPDAIFCFDNSNLFYHSNNKVVHQGNYDLTPSDEKVFLSPNTLINYEFFKGVNKHVLISPNFNADIFLDYDLYSGAKLIVDCDFLPDVLNFLQLIILEATQNNFVVNYSESTNVSINFLTTSLPSSRIEFSNALQGLISDLDSLHYDPEKSKHYDLPLLLKECFFKHKLITSKFKTYKRKDQKIVNLQCAIQKKVLPLLRIARFMQNEFKSELSVEFINNSYF